MYQPGGAMLGLLVTFNPMLLPSTVIGSSTNRWFGSEEWVTAAGRISDLQGGNFSEELTVGGDLVIPVTAIGFTLYYFWSIKDSPWNDINVRKAANLAGDPHDLLAMPGMVPLAEFVAAASVPAG